MIQAGAATLTASFAMASAREKGRHAAYDAVSHGFLHGFIWVRPFRLHAVTFLRGRGGRIHTGMGLVVVVVVVVVAAVAAAAAAAAADLAAEHLSRN